MQINSSKNNLSPWSFYTALWSHKYALIIAALPWFVFAVIARHLVRYYSEPEAMNPAYIYTITNGLHFQEKAALFAGTPESLQILPLAWFGHAIFVLVLGLFATDFLRVMSGIINIPFKKYLLLPTLFIMVSFGLMGTVWSLYALHNTATEKQPGTYINETFKTPSGKTYVGNIPKPEPKTKAGAIEKTEKELPPMLDRIDRMTSSQPIAGIVIYDEADRAIKTLGKSLNIIVFLTVFLCSPILIQFVLGLGNGERAWLSLGYKNIVQYAKLLFFPMIPLLLIFPPLALLCEQLRDVIPPYLAVSLWASLFSLKWFLYVALASHVALKMSQAQTTNEIKASTL